MSDCILCGHELREHYEDGCHERGLRRERCTCSYIQQPPLPPSADAAAHRARSDWWDGQARVSWVMATAAKDHLDSWYPLMRFHRLARRAELDHRRYAESLMRPRRDRREQPAPEPVPEPLPEYLNVLVEPVEPEPSLAQRLASAT